MCRCACKGAWLKDWYVVGMLSGKSKLRLPDLAHNLLPYHLLVCMSLEMSILLQPAVATMQPCLHCIL